MELKDEKGFKDFFRNSIKDPNYYKANKQGFLSELRKTDKTNQKIILVGITKLFRDSGKVVSFKLMALHVSRAYRRC